MAVPSLRDPGNRLAAVILPVLTAVLLHTALTVPRLGFLGLTAFLPLCWSVKNRRDTLSAARQGLLCGFVFFYADLFWITHAIDSFTALPFAATLLVMALLAGFFSLYFGAFAWLLDHCPPVSPPAVIFLAGAWTCLELGRSTMAYGFPWNLLGYTVTNWNGSHRLLALGGIYPLSFLVIYCNLALFSLWQSRHSRAAAAGSLGILVLLPVVILSLPLFGSPPPLDRRHPLQVSLIQPNIPQAIKWDPAYREQNFSRLEDLSRRAAAAAAPGIPHLVIWPEAAIPDFLQDAPEFRRRLSTLARGHHCFLLAGGPRFQRPHNGRKRKNTYYNSAFLFSPAGELSAVYDKVKLVPFGEFIPGGKFLPLVGKLVPGEDFSPGHHPSPLPLGRLKMAVSICFEGIFPAYIAKLDRGAGFLVNITNDSWFGETAGPRQHLHNTTTRAAENHCYLLRCANTGISAVVSPGGKVEKFLPLNREGIIQTTIFPAGGPTFYTRHPWLAPGLIIVVTAVAWLGTRRRGFA